MAVDIRYHTTRQILTSVLTTARNIDRVEAGINRQLDHDRYFTTQRTVRKARAKVVAP